RVPANYTFVDETTVQQNYKDLTDAAVAIGGVYGGRLDVEKTRFLSYIEHINTSHVSIIVDWDVKGEGPLQGGGGLDLDVDVTVANFPRQSDFNLVVDYHYNRIRNLPSSDVQNGNGLTIQIVKILGARVGYQVGGPGNQIREIFKVDWHY